MAVNFELVRALLLDFSCGSPTAGASHDRLLEIAASPEPELWSLLVRLLSDASTEDVMLMSVHVLLFRLRRVRTLSPDERYTLAASLPDIYTRSAPLAAAAAAGRSPSPPLAAACTQLWARALVTGCAPAHVQAVLVRAVQVCRLHEVDMGGWYRHTAHGGFSPATCVALLTACIELCVADTFETERQFLDMRAMVSALLADILPRIIGWFGCFLVSQPAHVQLSHSVGLPLLQLLHAACAGADVSLGSLRASGILTSLCHAITHLGAAFVDLLAFVASTASPHPSSAAAAASANVPFLAAAPASSRDLVAQTMHALLDTVSECVAMQTYPLHAEHNAAIDQLIALMCTSAHPLLSHTAHISANPALRSQSDIGELCARLAGGICRLAAQIGEREAERICGVDADAEASVAESAAVSSSLACSAEHARGFMALMLECTAHPTRAVVESSLEFWHCVQAVPRDERPAWSVEPVLVPLVGTLLTQLTRTSPFAALASLQFQAAVERSSDWNADDDDCDGEDGDADNLVHADLARLQFREQICETLAAVAPMILADALRTLLEALSACSRSSSSSSSSSSRNSGNASSIDASSWWRSAEAVAVAMRALEPAVRQHLTFSVPHSETDDAVSFYVGQILATFLHLIVDAFADRSHAHPLAHPCSALRPLLAHIHSPVLSFPTVPLRLAASPPALLLAMLPLFAAYAKWWARSCPALPASSLAVADSAACLALARTNAAHAIGSSSMSSTSEKSDHLDAASRVWSCAVWHLMLGAHEALAASFEQWPTSGMLQTPALQYQQQCAAVLWLRTSASSVRVMTECGRAMAANPVCADARQWCCDRAVAVSRAATRHLVRCAALRCVALAPHTAAAFGLHAAAASSSAAFAAASSASAFAFASAARRIVHASISAAAPLECFSALLAAAPDQTSTGSGGNVGGGFAAIPAAFAAFLEHACQCACALQQYTSSATSAASSTALPDLALFLGDPSPTGIAASGDQAALVLVQLALCVAGILRPWAGTALDEERDEHAMAASVSALVQPLLPLWTAGVTLCASSSFVAPSSASSALGLIASIAAVAVAAARAIPHAAIVHASLSQACHTLQALLQLHQSCAGLSASTNTASAATPVSFCADSIACVMDASAHLLEAASLAPSTGEARMRAALASLPFDRFVDLLIAVGAFGLELVTAASSLASPSPTAAMELVGAQCACLTSSIALLIGMLSDPSACGAGNEAALTRVLQTLLMAGIPQSERALCTWPGESPFVLRILSFWTAALRIPRDIRFMRRMQQHQQSSPQVQYAGSSDSAVDHAVAAMAAQCAELMTRRLLMAVAHDLPQPEAVVAELAGAWLEACQCTDAAAAAWPAWWRAWLGEHAARFGLGRVGQVHGQVQAHGHGQGQGREDQGTAAAIECIVQAGTARVADGRVRPWRDMIVTLSRVLRGAAAVDAMAHHL